MVILRQINSIQGEASMSSCRRTGLRENLIYSATPPPRRVWTRSALKTFKLLTEISASSNDSVRHASVKIMVDGVLEDFGHFGIEGQQLVSNTVMAGRSPK